MAAGVLEQEEKAIQDFLSEVNLSQGQRHRSPVSWGTGCKFLMARKFDVKRAIDLFFSHESTREKEDLLSIDPSDRYLQKELSTEKFTILPGRDRSGAAVALFSARLHQPPQTTHQVVLKSLIYQLDAALESIETQRQGLVFIYDMTESKYANFDYDLSIKILNLLKGAYPARLKRVLIVTAPLWFKAPFKILRLFVKEKLRDRVYTVSVSELITYVPKDTLPIQLGGTQVPCHQVWLQLCFQCATNQQPDPCIYFISRLSGPGANRGSISRSISTDTDNHISDFDSESSKDTVNEKHTNEDREKEKEDDMEEESGKPDSTTVVSKEREGQKVGNRKRKTSESRKHSSDLSTVNEAPPETLSEEMPRKKRPPSSGSNILDDSIHMPDTNGMTVQELLNKVNSLKRKGLVGEYGSIKMEAPTGTFTTSKLKANLPKNRYTDVLCYDHSRVTLPLIDDDPTSDYINANFVDGYMQKNAFISTQGPLPKTFVDFWRMVWHNQTKVIVMTTKTIERSRMKCGQYWPNEEEADEQFEEFIVYNNGMSQNKDFIETVLMLHNTNSGESRQISHLQFISWPDYGVPPAAPFLDFLFRVRSIQEKATKDMASDWTGHPLGPPIIVHCSAGIGRTGTFITVDICLRRLEDVGTVDVRETVRRIRSQRAFSIQMPDQYVFCHQAVIEQAQRQGLMNSIEQIVLEDSDSD
ncbi:tyrosine-protein phosphatase non-receptor type 9 isoform X2 [Aplysia californica]|uniref:Tyrosine-protein phosphatase non-receptor type 9 isoform X2 n=1 Tax=Aplysia californica TaxID=6500 RepID=A0ABM0JJ57_APLCA|nr:tyrosine-protein phosphatase non-receptor type 9 isoform X2 [Aplysia californica]